MRPFALLEGLLVVGLAITLITKPASKVPVMVWPDDRKPVRMVEPAKELADDACCQLTSDPTESPIH